MALHDLAKNTKLDLNVLSEDELEKLHKVLLIILDDLIHICTENNLHFILIGGSAIGALRSKGFIPWDDDIDIAMPRDDFQKLYEIVRLNYSDKYSIIHPQNPNNFGRILPKIRLKETTYRTILEYDLNECGVFIDIYTIENVSNNQLIRCAHGVICLGMGFFLSCIGSIISFVSIEKWAQWTDYWYSKCKDKKSTLVCIPTDDYHFFGEIYERTQFCNYTKIIFEGRECYLPQNYDSYLKRRYGEYMTPPDESKHERNVYLSYDLGKYREGWNNA